MKEKHIQAFMKTAWVFSECSTAQRLKVGCVAVKDDRILSIGYNGTPVGWPSNQCENDRGETLPEVLHAESNMLMKLCASHDSSEGATLFCTHSPCLGCAKLILQAKIKTLYYDQEYRTPEGLDFLQKAGIEVCRVKSTPK